MMHKESSISKSILRTCIAGFTALCISGCAASPANTYSKVDEEREPVIKIADTAPVIKVAPKEPAMVLKESTDNTNEADNTAIDPNDFHGYLLTEDDKSNPRLKCMETASEGEVTLLFAGDINFDDGYSNMNAFRSVGGITGVLSSDLINVMREADIFMINNEFPYSDRGTPTPNKTFTFRAKPERVSIMNEIGADIVSLANNHAYDYGAQALLDTFDILTNADIPYVGAGKDIDEACSPYYFVAGGMKIGIVSATQIERNDPPDTKEATSDSPGVLRTLDPTRFVKVIEESEANADFTVVYVHWGSENTYDVDDSQKSLAQKYEAAGADLIIGDHSHCLQGFEYINDTPIIYSLGNFWFSSKNIDTGLVKAVLSKDDGLKVFFIPCLQHDCRTDMYKTGDSEYDRILGVMAYLSPNVSIHSDGLVTNQANQGVAPIEPKPLKKASYQLTPEEQLALLQQEQLASQADN